MSFKTPDLCDQFEAELGKTVRVVAPMFKRYGGRAAFAGEIVTLKIFEDNTLVKEALDSPGEGRVLVVAAGASVRRAVVGGNLAAAAARNGWAGVVIDGCVRDVAELAQSQVGIRALASMPLPTERKVDGLRDVAVQRQGVWVRPGDWLYADEDGIVVADRALA